MLGVSTFEISRLLGKRRPETSWVVNGKTCLPTGYRKKEMHPDLQRSPEIISDPDRLRGLCQGKARAVDGTDGTALPSARHDAFFRLLVASPRRAARLLYDYLPPDVADRLDPEHPPVHVEGTMIDGEGGRTQADAIFRIRLRDGGEALVYALLEH